MQFGIQRNQKTYEFFPFSNAKEEVCGRCIDGRLNKSPLWNPYKDGTPLLLARLASAGYLRQSDAPCNQCGAHRTTWRLSGTPPVGFIRYETPIPLRILNVLQAFRQTLCLDCLDVATEKPFPAFGYKETSGHWISSMLETGHVKRRGGLCSRCDRNKSVFEFQEEKRVRKFHIIRKLCYLIPLFLALTLFYGAIILLSFWIEQRYWQPAPLIIAVRFFIFATFFFICIGIKPNGNYIFSAVGAAAHLFTAPVLYCISFLIIVRGIWLYTGDQFFDFSLQPTEITWLRYLLDNVVRVLLLDFAEIYGLPIGDVSHKYHWMISSFIFIFRTTLGIGIAKIIIRGYYIFKSPLWRYEEKSFLLRNS